MSIKFTISPPIARAGAPARTLLVCALMSSLIVGCTAGDPRFTVDTPAGFWVGLWHGMISWVTLVIGIFSDQIGVYEAHNSGGWYDLGFLLGVGCLAGGGSHSYRRRAPSCSRSDQQEWEEIGKKVERKLQRKIQQWAEADPDEEWEVIGKKAEAKLKQKLRSWAEDGEEGTQQGSDERGARGVEAQR